MWLTIFLAIYWSIEWKYWHIQWCIKKEICISGRHCVLFKKMWKKMMSTHLSFDWSYTKSILIKISLSLPLSFFHTDCSSYPARCDFEQNGICDWKQSMDDDFGWNKATGSRCRAETGPCVDHTTLSRYGHYMYIDSMYHGKGGCGKKIIFLTK